MAVVVCRLVTYCVMREVRETDRQTDRQTDRHTDRVCVWVGEVRSTLFFPRKADSCCTMRGESSSSSSNSSTLGGHGTSLIDITSSLSRSATLRINCSLLTPVEVLSRWRALLRHMYHPHSCHKLGRCGSSEGGTGSRFSTQTPGPGCI